MDNKYNINDELNGNLSSPICPSSISEIPVPVKKRAFLFLTVTSLITLAIFISHFLLPDFYYIEMLIASLILDLYALVKAFIIIVGTMKFGYICLKGYVVNVYTEKFDKKSFIIQMYDEERDLYMTFKYAGNKSIDPGIPISLYLSPTEKVENKDELGNTVEGYLAVVFTTDELMEAEKDKSSVQDLLSKPKQND